MTWAALIASVVKLMATMGPIIALWMANRAGKTAGKAEANYEQTTTNAKARQEYEKIEVQGVTDDDTDKILKDGSL